MSSRLAWSSKRVQGQSDSDTCLKNKHMEKIIDLIQKGLRRVSRLPFEDEDKKVEESPRNLSRCPAGLTGSSFQALPTSEGMP